MAAQLAPSEFILKKRNGETLTPEEIAWWIKGYLDGSVVDYQMSAWLMSVYFRGLSLTETIALTHAMIQSGQTLDLSALPFPKIDKHSTGGVGDKTSLVLAPLVAALGVGVPMMSGRGLGHTGGTLDKLSSIPGFHFDFNLDKFLQLLKQYRIAFLGQTELICPADKRIYALRDVTGTVESVPLIAASIMSKKIAEGIDGLVLDLKVGQGAFMKTLKNAQELAEVLVSVGEYFGKKVKVLMSSMDQPLGAFAGNALEVSECLRVLRNETHLDAQGINRGLETRTLSLELAARMLVLAGASPNLDSARERANRALESGQAYEKFCQIIAAQGGRISELPSSPQRLDVFLGAEGFISKIDTEGLGWALVHLKGGRKLYTDQIDPTVGFEFHAKVGEYYSAQNPVLSIHGKEISEARELESEIKRFFSLESEPPKQIPPLIIQG